MNVMGNQDMIHPTLIWDDETVILVDAGLPSQLPEIQKVMEQVGVPFSKLNKVILTHQDLDHISEKRSSVITVEFIKVMPISAYKR